MRLSIQLGLRTGNPFDGVDFFGTASAGYYAWSEGDIAA
jgi:hypothetical protein